MTSNTYGLRMAPPQPRRFEELHAERSYLLSSLQQENVKATELLRKLPPLEEILVRSQVSHVKRRARKQLGWMIYRINEATRQERTILNRLGQLAQEIQSRERWNQIESEQRYRGQPFSRPVVPCYEMQQMYLTQMTPTYQLQEFPFPYMQTPHPTPPQQQKFETGRFSWPESYQDQVFEMPSEIWSPLTLQGNENPAQKFHFETQTSAFETAGLQRKTRMQRSSSMNDALDVEVLATHTPPVPPLPIKRHHSTGGRGPVKIWSDTKGEETEDESSESSQYSGYFINR